MKTETWKPIPEYEGLYEASNLGRVKSLPRLHRYGNKKEVILRDAIGSSGYRHVALTKNGAMKTIRVHRIVAMAFIKKQDGCDFVNHIDGNKLNNNVSNLEWVTKSYNAIHFYQSGIQSSEKRASKVTAKDVVFIRQNHKMYSRVELSERFNISTTHLSQIINNKTWNYL